MALTEEKVLASVEVCIEASTINVKWLNRIKRDGEVISEVPHRCAYSQSQKEQFVAEVEGGSAYVAAVGW